MAEVLIVGGGITGLTLGHELAKKGLSVTIVEKENRIGGLSRSFRYDGFTFDIGPHRFHTENARVSDFIEEVLKDQTLSISRDSQVYFKQRYYHWPLRPSILLNLPLSIQMRTAFDLLLGKINIAKTARNFQEYTLNNYGPTLYNHFFKDYTRKFLDISPDLLDLDWAKVGMSAAIIDERLPHEDLWELFKLAIKPLTDRTSFLYPKGGVGLFCNKLAGLLELRGGTVLKGSAVEDIYHGLEKIVSVVTDNKVLECDTLIWTGSIGDICRLLGLEPPGLKYRSLVLYNILLKTKTKRNFQWCYFGEGDIIFNRVTNSSLFDLDSAPKDKTGLCVEVTCQENDEKWADPEKLIPRIKEDLIKTDLIGGPDAIDSIYIERIPDAYPIYDLEYQRKLAWTKARLGKFKNLILAGRTGLFWYNNMDDSIVNGLDVARKINNV